MVVSFPNQDKNYCVFSNTVLKRCNSGIEELPNISKSLSAPNSESEIIEDLFILNCMLDNGIDKSEISKLYPLLSKYNTTESPSIQTFLAGIYRKTDALPSSTIRFPASASAAG